LECPEAGLSKAQRQLLAVAMVVVPASLVPFVAGGSSITLRRSVAVGATTALAASSVGAALPLLVDRGNRYGVHWDAAAFAVLGAGTGWLTGFAGGCTYGAVKSLWSLRK
jgi:hypothetical protein